VHGSSRKERPARVATPPCPLLRASERPARAQAAGGTYDAALETQLCFEVKTFLLAGHETSAAMLTWSLYELVCHPKALARVRPPPPSFLNPAVLDGYQVLALMAWPRCAPAALATCLLRSDPDALACMRPCQGASVQRVRAGERKHWHIPDAV